MRDVLIGELLSVLSAIGNTCKVEALCGKIAIKTALFIRAYSRTFGGVNTISFFSYFLQNAFHI